MAFKVKTQKKITKLLGLEFSENDIIATEILFSKDKANITSGFRLHLPIFQDTNKTIALLKQNLKSLNIKTKECCIGFSMQYVKLFPTPIPTSIPKEEINSIIMQEGNVDPSKEIFSWTELTNTQRQDPDNVTRYDVLGISIQKRFIETAGVISKICNLNLVSVAPSFLGLGFFLNPSQANNLVGTLWISEIRSEFIVWSGQEPIYEHLFLTHQLKDQVFESVNYIQSQLQGAAVSTIYTCGPFAREIDITQLPYNIQPFLLPSNIVDISKVLQWQGMDEYTTSIGIALASSNNFPYTVPNLLAAPQIKPQRKSIKDIFKTVPSTQLPFIRTKILNSQTSRFAFASALVVLFSIFTGLYVQSFLMPGIQTKQSSSQSKLMRTQSHLTKLLSIDKQNKVLNLKVDYFSELIDKRKPWSKILREIGDMSPKGLWIDRLEVRAKTINIFGRALNVDAVANFSINLNYTAKLVSKAQITTLRKLQEEGAEIVEYQVSANVKDQKQVTLDTNENLTLKPKSKI